MNRREFFEAAAAGWGGDPERDARTVARVREELAALGPLVGRRILDLGCGTGLLLSALDEAAGPAGSVIGLDAAAAMARRAATERAGGAAIAVGEAERLPLAAGNLDAVLCLATFAHVEDGPAVLRELARVLRPGGRALLLHLHSREELLAHHDAPGLPIRGDTVPTADELETSLSGTGLELIERTDRPGLHRVVLVRS